MRDPQSEKDETEVENIALRLYIKDTCMGGLVEAMESGRIRGSERRGMGRLRVYEWVY
jgi:hypothetical protein